MSDSTMTDQLGRGRRNRTRSIAAAALVVVAALGVVVFSTGLWLRLVALDTDSFMEVVEPVLTGDEFSTALSVSLSEAAIEAVDAQSRLERRLALFDDFLTTRLVEALDLGPRGQELLGTLDLPRFEDLAVPLAQGLNSRISDGIGAVVSSDEFDQVLVALVRAGHAGTVALLTDAEESLPNVYVEDGLVKWNLLPVMISALERVVEQGLLEGEDLTLPDLSDDPLARVAISRIEAALGVQVRDDLGQVTVMTEDDLVTMQATFGALNRALWIEMITTMLVALAALLISVRRRRTTMQMMFAILVAVALTVLSVDRAIAGFAKTIEQPGQGIAVGEFADELAGSLRGAWLVLVIVALVIVAITVVAGHPRWLERSSQRVRSAGDARPGATALDRYVDRRWDLLIVIGVGLSLIAIWAVNLSLGGTLLTLVVFAVLFVLGQMARRRVAEQADRDAESHTTSTRAGQ